MKEDRKYNWKFWLGLGAGMAAGMTAGLFLNSDEGRVMRKRAEKRVDRLGKKLNKKLHEEMDLLASKANEALENTRELADKAKSTIKERMEHFSHS